MPLSLIALHFFVRLLLGLLLCSVGVSKLAHPIHFRRGIQDYQLIPSTFDSRLTLSTLLAYGLPLTICPIQIKNFRRRKEETYEPKLV